MSTKKIREALELLSGLQAEMRTTAGYAAVGETVVAARAEVQAIKKAAVSHVQNRRLWRKIAEES